jgi:hypothetical protein
MSGRGTKVRAGRALGILAIGAGLLCAAAPPAAGSSAADRERFVKVVHMLERAPLDPALKEARGWALDWLIQAPDVSVELCLESLNGMANGKYAYAPELTVQDSLSMGAFAIEHPEAANDAVAQQVAGAEGALLAYRAILKDKPGAHLAALDGLLEIQARGGLADFERDALKRCSAKR